MKKFLGIVGMLVVAMVSIASAGMQDYVVTRSIAGAGPISTNISILRGNIEAIVVDVPATGSATCTVTVATVDGAQTILSKSGIASDAVYYPRIKANDTSANALTSYSLTPNVTNAYEYVKIPVAGQVSVKIDPSATVSNAVLSYTVKVFYSE